MDAHELRSKIFYLSNEVNKFCLSKISKDVIDQPIYNVYNVISKIFNENLSNEDIEFLLLISEVLIDVSWERLNCGTWKDVPIAWRYLYGYASFYKAICLMLQNDNQENRLKSLHCLDLGLIMSPQIGDNLLAKLASFIHKQIFQEKIKHEKTIVEGGIESKKKKLKTGDDTIERVCGIELEELKENFLDKKIPVIITDAISFWPCLNERKWTLNYLIKNAAYRTVPIEIGSKYTDESWSQKLMTLEQFIHDFIIEQNNQIGYLAQHNLFEQIEELRKDFCIPDYCSISKNDNVNVDINAWFGPSGTVSPLHYDQKDNLLCQVMGSKYIRLYSDETPEEIIYPHQSNLLSNTSQVDVENVDVVKFPLFSQANYYDCHLHEGECLFIPKGFWHFVKSLTTSFSISFWWE